MFQERDPKIEFRHVLCVIKSERIKKSDTEMCVI